MEVLSNQGLILRNLLSSFVFASTERLPTT